MLNIFEGKGCLMVVLTIIIAVTIITVTAIIADPAIAPELINDLFG
jgi:hypothetical protein